MTSMTPLRVYVPIGYCGNCGERIELYGNRRYCSRRCKERDAARRRRNAIQGACKICGQPAAVVKRGRGGGPRCTDHQTRIQQRREEEP